MIHAFAFGKAAAGRRCRRSFLTARLRALTASAPSATTTRIAQMVPAKKPAASPTTHSMTRTPLATTFRLRTRHAGAPPRFRSAPVSRWRGETVSEVREKMEQDSGTPPGPLGPIGPVANRRGSESPRRRRPGSQSASSATPHAARCSRRSIRARWVRANATPRLRSASAKTHGMLSAAPRATWAA